MNGRGFDEFRFHQDLKINKTPNSRGFFAALWSWVVERASYGLL